MSLVHEPLSTQVPTTMQLVQQAQSHPQPPSHSALVQTQQQEPRGYQKQPKHLPILTIKNLFDIQSESSSASASSLLQSDHSLQSTATPFNRSNTSSISTYDNNHHNHHQHRHHHHHHNHHSHNHQHKRARNLDCGLTVANHTHEDGFSVYENSPVDEDKVVLEVYEQNRKPCTTAIQSHSSPLSVMNFNFEFDNWSLDELPPMDDGKFNERIKLESANNSQPGVLLLLLPLQGDIEPNQNGGDEAMDQSMELNSMIESMKELTLLDRFKGMIRKNSTNMLKRLNSSSFDLLLFKNGENGFMDATTRIVVPSSSLSLSNSPSPSKIKFEEYVKSESDEPKDQQNQQNQHDQQDQANSMMPSVSTSTPTPITPNNYYSTFKSTRHHKRNKGKLSTTTCTTPSSSSSSPKRKKSFLHLRSASLPFNFFDFKLNRHQHHHSHYNHHHLSKGDHKTSDYCCSQLHLDPPKLILKCKVNQNYNQESIESIKQDLIQFDEFWRKFELMEQAKNNYSNDELLNTMRLEQVRNYYYGN